jgi:hypothetical protein
MPEPFKVYLDQMLRMDVAQALRDEGQGKYYQSSSPIFISPFFRGI